ncbi:hypothetical protein AB4Y36_38300 [Paraburkholderia sp. BR10936]|uniref:hypothetical protein n=1 Tax=Paraburkholderia sp. BR10936 TaxID=3236993 RepID=UPI0034D17082
MFPIHHDASGAKFAMVGQIAGIPVIHDLNGRMSVTNAAEDVVRTVLLLCNGTQPPAIIYRDSRGIYDAMRIVNGRFYDFILTGADTDVEAFNRIADLLRKPRPHHVPAESHARR